MEFLKLSFNPRYEGYSYKDASDMGMCILANFFSSDVRCSGRSFFKDWALNDAEIITGGNATALEKDNGFVVLFDGTESMTEEIRANGFKISRDQFVQLLDDWKEKVCEKKPKEVVIKYENEQFILETYN